ncbi:MAG: 23S rRNA pseudouridine synthase F, partial [Clostridium perfringens]
KLERIRILNITLEDIEYGKWRYINREEIEILKKLIK